MLLVVCGLGFFLVLFGVMLVSWLDVVDWQGKLSWIDVSFGYCWLVIDQVVVVSGEIVVLLNVLDFVLLLFLMLYLIIVGVVRFICQWCSVQCFDFKFSLFKVSFYCLFDVLLLCL